MGTNKVEPKPGELWILDVTDELVLVLGVDDEFFYEPVFYGIADVSEASRVDFRIVKVLHTSGEIGCWSENFLYEKIG